MPRAQYPFVTFEYPDGQLDSPTNPPVLLGVEGLLDHFKLTVDYPKGIIRFQW